ncbi:MAG TPA: DNA translocase FtsK [Bacillota bacterium]
MLERWKKRLQNMIWEEVEEEQDMNEEDRQPLEHLWKQKAKTTTNIQTKMMYKYPKNTPLRFPSGGKQRQTQDTNEIPAYQRRQENQRTENNEMGQRQFDQTEREQNNQREKPFKPSRVASPIYGYQKRSEVKRTEEIPAFVRKRKQLSQNKVQQKREREKNDRIENVTKTETIPSNEKNVRKRQSTVNEKHTSSSLENRPDRKKKVRRFPNKPNAIQQKKQTVKKNKHHRKVKNIKNRTQRPIPYNVMMMPVTPYHLQNNKRKTSSSRKKTQSKEQENQDERHQHFPIDLLAEPLPKSTANHLWIKEQQALLDQTLKHFRVRAKVVHATQGPSVTRFEVQPELGVKVSKIKNLSDDLKLNMAAKDIRIEAPIPGKNTVGIEVPNPAPQAVGLREIFVTKTFKASSSPLTVALGLNIEGDPVAMNIQKMPHGLIAGATGSGKSVCINSILISLLYKATPDEVKFLLIDPKMVELAPYNGIPHLVSPVITDVKAATAALKWAVNEMEDRYQKFVEAGVRNIETYNEKMEEVNALDKKMPFLIIVIDELADLMMMSPQDVEESIARIAQKARAAGIHLLVATQRPSVDVITGLIKANIPTRIAFSVSSQVDSRTIIDTSGAEKLLGKGDMLFIENGARKSVRLQGPFVSDEEIEKVTNYVKDLAPTNYLFEQQSLLEQMTTDEEEDELFEEAVQFVLHKNRASTSLLQRHFKIGYNRAARMIDTMETRGIVSQQNGSKPRDVLVTSAQVEDMFL